MLNGVGSSYRVCIWCGKTRTAGLQSGEGRMIIDSVVWAQYVNVTDKLTDGHVAIANSAQMHCVVRQNIYKPVERQASTYCSDRPIAAADGPASASNTWDGMRTIVINDPCVCQSVCHDVSDKGPRLLGDRLSMLSLPNRVRLADGIAHRQHYMVMMVLICVSLCPPSRRCCFLKLHRLCTIVSVERYSMRSYTAIPVFDNFYSGIDGAPHDTFL